MSNSVMKDRLKEVLQKFDLHQAGSQEALNQIELIVTEGELPIFFSRLEKELFEELTTKLKQQNIICDDLYIGDSDVSDPDVSLNVTSNQANYESIAAILVELSSKYQISVHMYFQSSFRASPMILV